MADPVADIALIGLAVMGQNIILNMNDHGFVVCAFNRTVAKVDHFYVNLNFKLTILSCRQWGGDTKHV